MFFILCTFILITFILIFKRINEDLILYTNYIPSQPLLIPRIFLQIFVLILWNNISSTPRTKFHMHMPGGASKTSPTMKQILCLLLCLNFLISCIRLNDPRSRRRRAGKLTLRALRSRQVNFVNGPKSQCQLQLQTRQTSKWLALADRAESREPNPNTCGNSWSKLSHDATPTAHRLASAWHWHCHCIRVVVVAVVARASERMSPTCSVPYASVTQCRAKEEMRSRPVSWSGSLACQRKERKKTYTHTYADKHMDREKDEQCRHRWDWPGWARVAHENGNGTHGARLSWESVRSTQAHWSRVGVM